ncbi:hypothetical protein C8Q70DRAFT_915874 [Cubamyces menziesii]|uniref:Uncharacterized protein n=1 Tax=Trametes cubensis TaxID=1111947 RepID=A0AAD7TU44_9APHY|nr:hypothetical protein C8Q70DRAFT_915874 [Cubamyces menziesii]KAJ8482476.1 hypothetical protein ONZ51_g5326 [Trametes cubensis]
MATEQVDYSMSKLSLGSNASDVEDWDRSMSSDADPNQPNTPRNSVSFPGHGAADNEGTPGRNMSLGRGVGKRTLSELLKLHAEEGTDVNFTPEEATRVAEVLGQWINSASSPYEAEDDFFSRQHSQDDSSIAMRSASGAFESSGRPRGQSESVVNNGAQS